MDLEPLYFIFRQDWPVHRIFHTFLGCHFPALVSIFLGKLLCELLLKISNAICGTHLEIRIGWRVTAVSVLAGVYSHVILDGLMHRDMKPLWPFSADNPLLRLANSSQIHVFCILCAVVAVVILICKWGVRRLNSKARR